MDDETDLTKVTVNLVPKAMDALRRAVLVTEMTRTDTINRALQLYAFVVEGMADGDDLYFHDRHGRVREITMDYGGTESSSDS